MRIPAVLRPVVPALLAFALVSCAVSGGTDSASSPPPLTDSYDSPVRANMRPEHRVFFDMLEGLGDWTLVEPYGYVFRPNVNIVAWRPYTNGYWAPSNDWGWVWVSADEFGWATDHYGRWIDDRFQDWVWVPGVQWGPAWVQWAGDDEYVGWAPLLAASGGFTSGAYTFVPVSALPATDLSAHVVKPDALQARAGGLRPIDRAVEREGVSAPAGPDLEWVERRTGPLTRARVDDVVRPGELERDPQRPDNPHEIQPYSAGGLAERSAARRAAMRAAEDAHLRARTGAPASTSVRVVRPFAVPGSEAAAPAPAAPAPAAPAPPKPGRKPAPADSTR
jgi:hypothetical protein